MTKPSKLDDVLKQLQQEHLLDPDSQLGLVRGGAEARDSCHGYPRDTSADSHGDASGP
jgi:hypothetical protein